MSSETIVIEADPHAAALTRGVLDTVVPPHHPEQLVIVATGDFRHPYLPVRGVTWGPNRELVLEL